MKQEEKELKPRIRVIRQLDNEGNLIKSIVTMNGRKHSIEGPAHREWEFDRLGQLKLTRKEYWLNGIEYTKDEWEELV